MAIHLNPWPEGIVYTLVYRQAWPIPLRHEVKEFLNANPNLGRSVTLPLRTISSTRKRLPNLIMYIIIITIPLQYSPVQMGCHSGPSSTQSS